MPTEEKMIKTKKRSDDLIISQILEVCMNGAGKTRIIYQANLNSLKVNHYLDNMIKNGLIIEIPYGSRSIYKTTPKVLELNQRLQRLQIEIDALRSSLLDAEV
jgi:predicted transcriptional regulator